MDFHHWDFTCGSFWFKYKVIQIFGRSRVCRFLYGLTSEEAEELLSDIHGLTQEQITAAKNKYDCYISLCGRKVYSFWFLLEYAIDPDGDHLYGWKNTGAILGLQNALKIAKGKEMIERELLLNKFIPVEVGTVMTIYEVIDMSAMDNEKCFSDT